MNLYSALLRALAPFISAALVTGGIQISPALLGIVTDNVSVILLGLGALATAFPSIKAAIKFREKAE